MNIGNEIKKLAVDNGMTLTHLAKVISDKKGTANFILDEMGYEIIFRACSR